MRQQQSNVNHQEHVRVHEQQQQAELGSSIQKQSKCKIHFRSLCIFIKQHSTTISILIMTVMIFMIFHQHFVLQKKILEKVQNLYNFDLNKEKVVENSKGKGQQSRKVRQRKRINKVFTLGISPDWTPFPKILWLYQDTPIDKFTPIEKRNYQNIHDIAKKSNYLIKIIKESNFQQFVQPLAAEKINKMITEMKRRIKDNDRAYDLANSRNFLTKQLISLYALQQEGGILLDRTVILTQDFSWLDNIQTNPYFNRGVENPDPQILAFFNQRNGPKRVLINDYDLQSISSSSFMFISLSIESYFIASKAGAAFITEWIEEFQTYIYQPNLDDLREKFDKINFGDYTHTKQSYSSYFYKSSNSILHKKQLDLDTISTKKNKTRSFAIDHYGLYAMNSKYFALKITYTEFNILTKMYNYLFKLSYTQLQQIEGPLRYFVFFTQSDLKFFWNVYQQQENSSKALNHKDSFFKKYLFDVETPNNYPLNTVLDSTQTWDSLPKKVWIYWGSGFEQSAKVTQLCLKNFQFQLNNSGWELIKLGEENFCQFLSFTNCARINQILDNAKMQIHISTRSNLIRLFILQEHGGVWIDANTILLEDLSWLTNLPSNPFLVNKFGSVPSAFLSFLPYLPSDAFDSMHLVSDKNGGLTRAIQSVGYESSFIAVDINSSLINDWIYYYTHFLLVGVSSTFKQYKAINMSLGKGKQLYVDQYLIFQQSLDFLIQKKNFQLNIQSQKNGSSERIWAAGHDHYKLWMLNSIITPFKFVLDHFDEPSGAMMVEYSRNYTEGIKGKLMYYIKMTHQNYIPMNQIFGKSKDEISQQINKDSIVSQFLLKHEK